MKIIVINPELMQAVVKATSHTKKRKTTPTFSTRPRPKKDYALASNRYPNKKKK
jgi:hypothetical protein